MRTAGALKCHPRLESLEDRLLPSTYAVINTADSGQGSLRQAILDADANPGPNTIIFDIRGEGAHTIQPLTPLPAITRPVVIDATYQPGYNGTPLIELDGHLAGAGAVGLTIQTGNLTGSMIVTGLDINRFAGSGIRIQNLSGSASAVIQGSYIGTDVTGGQALGNGIGVDVQNIFPSNSVTIGGTAAGAGNLISGNGTGIHLFMSHANIQGNYIGTDVTGTQALRNGTGVDMVNESLGTMIGGTAANAGNLISGNGLAIRVASGSAGIQGNRIGTDVAGHQALGNGTGVTVLQEGSTTIGGRAAGAGNVISGNTGSGIVIQSNVVVQGNLIGTDITGTQPLGNGANGISVLSEGVGQIGGTQPGTGNVVSANSGDGILLSSTSLMFQARAAVQGNLIGTDITGTQPLGNGGNGVTFSGQAAVVSTVGGTAAGAANTIAFNSHDGVLVDRGGADSIRANAIFSSGNQGIELLDNGNHNQAAPVLTSAVSDGSTSTTIQGTLTSTPSAAFALDFFANDIPNPSGFGEGQQFLGTISATTDASGMASFMLTLPVGVAAGRCVSVTATASSGDTSAFAADIVVAAGPFLPSPTLVALAPGQRVESFAGHLATIDVSDHGQPFLSTPVFRGFSPTTINSANRLLTLAEESEGLSTFLLEEPTVGLWDWLL